MPYQYPPWAAGQDITAGTLTAMEVSYVYKTAATLRAVTTFSDDPDLTFPVVAGGVYLIEWHMSYGGLAAAGLSTIWDVPTGSSGVKNCNGPGSSANNASAENIAGMYGSLQFTTQAQYGCARNVFAAVQYAFENAIVHVASTGNVALQWAQTTSNAAANQMGTGSWGRCASFSDTPGTSGEGGHVDPAWISAACALVLAIAGIVGWGGRWAWRIARRVGHFLDDYNGEPARDGLAARPGFMARLASLEDSMAHVVAETKPNHGNSLRDVVARTAQDVANMRGRMELFEKQREGRDGTSNGTDQR